MMLLHHVGSETGVRKGVRDADRVPVRTMTRPSDWRDDAACRDADADLFFPVGTMGPALRQIDEAKRICRACPAQAACLAWAIEAGITSGVWGGTTEDERRALRLPAEKK
jgi:WhiB family redox-sensing transcriptional regulator